MNICASYHSDLTHRLLLNEIRYPIGLLDSALEELEKRPNVIIILEIMDLANMGIKIQKLEAIIQENPNIVIDCYDLQDFITLRHQSHIEKMMYHYPQDNYAKLWYIMQFNPYAVTISEPLVFDIQHVREAVNNLSADEENPTKIRVLPAIGKPSDWVFVDQDDGFNHFWILPHMAHAYEDYIDIFDLYDADPDREQALIDAYHIGRYDLQIGVLVKNCSSTIPALFIDDEFINHRMNCQQRCLRGSRNCHYCDMFKRTVAIARPNRS